MYYRGGASLYPRAPLFLLALLAACSSSDPRWLPAPSAKAVLVFELTAAGVTKAEAHEISEAAELWSVEQTQRQVVALAYDRPLSDLGLKSGPLQPSADGGLIPTSGATIFQLNVQPSGLGGWEEQRQLPQELKSLRLAELLPCARFDAQYYRLPATQNLYAEVGLPIDDSHALVAINDGRFFEASRSGARLLTELSTATPHHSGFRTSGGELWLAGRDARLVHGTVAGGFTPAPPLEIPASGVILDGAHEDAPFELYALSADLRLARFDGSRWTTLTSSAAVDDRTRPRLGWIEPGKVAVIGPATDRVLEVQVGGRTQSVGLDVALTDSVFAIAHVDRVGSFIGTRNGRAFLRTTDGWKEQRGAPSTVKVDVITAAGDGGMLMGGEGGEMVEWSPGYGYCPQILLGTGRRIEFAISLGRDLVVVSASSPDEMLIVYLSRTN